MQFQALLLFACLLQSVLARWPAWEPLPSFAPENGWSTITDHGLCRNCFADISSLLQTLCIDNPGHWRRIWHFATFLVLIASSYEKVVDFDIFLHWNAWKIQINYLLIVQCGIKSVPGTLSSFQQPTSISLPCRGQYSSQEMNFETWIYQTFQSQLQTSCKNVEAEWQEWAAVVDHHLIIRYTLFTHGKKCKRF